MQRLNENELRTLTGGMDPGHTACGVAVGITLGATFVFGFVGFALTWGKMAATCMVGVMGPAPRG